MIIGNLIRGSFVCKNCSSKQKSQDKEPQHIHVYLENIGQYSQSCSKCKTMVVTGIFGVELFRSVDESVTFGRIGAEALARSMSNALACNDDEAYESYRRKLYERVLVAIMEDKLQDKDFVFDIVGRHIK